MEYVTQLRVTISSPGVFGGPEGGISESLAIQVQEIQISHSMSSGGQINHSSGLCFLKIW